MRHEFSRQTPDLAATEAAFPHRIRTTRQIHCHLRPRFVHREQESVAPDAALVTQRLAQRFAEGKRAVFNGVVFVDVQVALAFELQRKTAMPRHLFEHVVEEPDARGNVDGPFCVYQGARLGQKCFRNFGGSRGAGPQTMRWGIEQSRNLMTVRAASQTGMDKVVETAARMGVSAPGKTYPKVLSIALGAGDTTVMRLTNAYAMLANNGKQMTPSLIDFVQDRRGKVIFRADTRPCERCNAKDWDGKAMPRPAARTKQAVDAMTAYQMVHILEGVIQRGTATALQPLKRPIFGKTGTTSGPTNVWFVGGSADLVAGLYMGYDRPRPMGGYAQGGTLAAPIFLAFAQKAMKDMPVMPFAAPPGIRMVRIDRRSGRKVFGAWPTDEFKPAVIWEAFKPESEPRRSIRKDEIAKPKKIDKAAGPKAMSAGDSDFLQKQDGIY